VATTQSLPPQPAPKVALLVMCEPCGEGVEVLMPIEHKALAILLAQRGWHLSRLTPPNQDPEVPVLFGVICSTCAPKVYPPEALRVAEEQRQAIVRMAAARPPQGTR
jgi:hypothetical protein